MSHPHRDEREYSARSRVYFRTARSGDAGDVTTVAGGLMTSPVGRIGTSSGVRGFTTEDLAGRADFASRAYRDLVGRA